jgi:imidazolonepropionase-like amidohydrolase
MHATTRSRLCLLSLLLLLIAAQAQPQPGRTLIRAGHIIDVHTGSEAADQTIIVTGERITAIAPTSSIAKQPDDEEIVYKNDSAPLKNEAQ